jgi:tetrapyrrole methylase family protein/MazG family protein
VLPGRHARTGARDVLLALYPPGHLLKPLSGGAPRAIDALTDDELTAGDWLVPALPQLDNFASPHGMAAISARLRAADGCPWDRRQTHASLRPFVLEEAYEAVDAIERGAPADLAEELGDLFLQIILHAQLAAEEGTFDLTDVYRTLGAKIVRRHPHVFGDTEVSGADEVLRNWEAIKAAERHEAGGPPSAFGGVARALPALAASREIQERASALGWDWPAIEGVWQKVGEELAELHVAGTLEGDPGRDARLHELGDVLFAAVNLARWMKLDPEEALRSANRRWIDRYERVEALAATRGLVLADLSAEAKDLLWNEVKAG